jgi:hypothetical protein
MLGCGGQISQGMYVCTECMYGMYVCMYVCMYSIYVCMYVCMHLCMYTIMGEDPSGCYFD